MAKPKGTNNSKTKTKPMLKAAHTHWPIPVWGIVLTACVVLGVALWAVPDVHEVEQLRQRRAQLDELLQTEQRLHDSLSPKASFHSTDKKRFMNWCTVNSRVGAFCMKVNEHDSDNAVYDEQCANDILSREQAIAVWQRGADRGCDSNAQDLGILLMGMDRIAEATVVFNNANTITRSLNKRASPRGVANIQWASKVSLVHAHDQLEYLVANNLVSESYQSEIEGYERLLPHVPVSNDGESLRINLGKEHLALIPSYRRRLFIDNKPRVADGTTLTPRPDNIVTEVEIKYIAEGIVVLDNLLTPTVLQSLLEFAMHSTIFYDDKPNGYVGSYFADGFSTPLLLQVADELRATFPNIFRDVFLEQAWAYSYDQEINSGIKMHGDEAAVNCNFWLTPNDANLDNTTGGLIVHTKPVPLNWAFSRFNSDAGQTEMEDLLRNSDKIQVPYRQNRMVMFKSDLLHATDTLNFKRGYKNRRINFTFLFGKRGQGEDAKSIRQRQERSKSASIAK